MRKLIWFIMLLALTGSARGQTSYSYRYWFDNDLSTVREGAAIGKTTIEIDISTLTKGTVHALHVQGIDERNKWGAVRTSYFFLANSKSATVRYWFDNEEDDTTVQTAPVANGLTDLDISGLERGAHALHYQASDAEGNASPVRTAYFFVRRNAGETATARYWYDDNEKAAQKTSVVAGMIDFDISQLPVGVHALHYQTFDIKGKASPVFTQHFVKRNELMLSSLTCRLWIDDDEDKAMTFSLMDDIEIMADDLVPGTHDLHVVVLNANGQQLAEGTTTFEVDAERTITITLQAPIVTFSSEKGLDFFGVTGFRAYTATGFHRYTGDVLMSRVEEAPAGEGLLLVGEPGTYEVTVRKSYNYYSNLLVGTPEATVLARTADGYDNYMLSFRDGEAGFYLAEDGSTVAAGKAYLRIPSDQVAGARKLRLSFDDNPDAVDSPLEGTEEGAVYNLAGQRLTGPQKGINIKDGKKILVK